MTTAASGRSLAAELRKADPALSRFDPLDRILVHDDFNTGTHGWIELLGCGMIHPNVLRQAGIDPEVYTGFAWGGGIERLVMMKYGIEDVRHFESGKLDFLRQFA